MIQVMHICSDTNIGGAGRYLLNLFEEADKTIYELTFVLPRQSQLTELLKQYGATVIESSLTPDTSLALKDIWLYRKLLRKVQPDIVHTHASLSARIAAKSLGIKGVVYTRHYVDTSVMGTTETKKSMLQRLKSFFNNALCDGVIGVAEQCEPVLLGMGIAPHKITIIPNGVVPIAAYTHQQKEAVRKQYGLTESDKVLTILARLSQEKGHLVFVDTVEKLLQQGERIKALIVGTGPEEKAIRHYIHTKDLQDAIMLTGFVEDVSAILNVTTIQMNTAYTEAQSLSLSEGMSLGVPAVVTNVGGNPSMITHGENGYVAEVGDSEELAKWVKYLLEAPQSYIQMSHKARETYEARYTATRMTRATEAFYQKLLMNKR